jgi:hypothetical protein
MGPGERRADAAGRIPGIHGVEMAGFVAHFGGQLSESKTRPRGTAQAAGQAAETAPLRLG